MSAWLIIPELLGIVLALFLIGPPIMLLLRKFEKLVDRYAAFWLDRK